jgi:hypothetical protein
MLNDLFHTLCYTVFSILVTLMTNNPVFLTSTTGKTADVTGQQRMFTAPWHMCCPTLDFVCFGILITFSAFKCLARTPETTINAYLTTAINSSNARPGK